MLVLLFDIDGTLVNTGGAGTAALRQAFGTEFCIEAPQDVPYSGRTDRAICQDMFGVHSVDYNDQNWNRLRDAYIRHLPQYLPKLRGRVLPGVTELLQRVTQFEDVALGLLTGNFREGARLKLEHYGLHHHFQFGGYGDEHLDRNHVAEMALESARQHVNKPFADDAVWVIGDTPLDIRCARWINAKVLAVATGLHPRDELAGLEPDVALDDLSDTEQVVSILQCE